jgi:hypothetical protein
MPSGSSHSGMRADTIEVASGHGAMISHPQEIHERIACPPIGGESLWSRRPRGQPAGAAIRGHRLSLGGVAAPHHAPRIPGYATGVVPGQACHIARPPTTLTTVLPRSMLSSNGLSAAAAHSRCRTQHRDSTPHAPTSTNAGLDREAAPVSQVAKTATEVRKPRLGTRKTDVPHSEPWLRRSASRRCCPKAFARGARSGTQITVGSQAKQPPRGAVPRPGCDREQPRRTLRLTIASLTHRSGRPLARGGR